GNRLYFFDNMPRQGEGVGILAHLQSTRIKKRRRFGVIFYLPPANRGLYIKCDFVWILFWAI
ncbi:MAG: hypothetical protein JW974_02970, partial [Alphaproteobacteria bacterium]|nr:hypothetical protein [Alphaproteobacteria bacterium]